MDFKKFGFKDKLLNKIKENGFKTPTKIQREAIPKIMLGRDVMASSQTGSGKSATYFLPILNSIEPKNTKTIKALILAPTRELCTQIHTMIESFNDELKVCAVFGGVKIAPQINKFKNGIDILVATPGRLLEHIKLGHV